MTDFDAMEQVRDQVARLLPLNRKERFYTGTVLPLILAADDFAQLPRFLEICGLVDLALTTGVPGMAPCQLVTEYGFKESLFGAADDRWGTRDRKRDTPDLVLVGDGWLLAVEAKMFDRPSAAALETQLAAQRVLLEEWAEVLAIPPTRLRHVALLPEGLANEVGALSVATITWEQVANAYRSVGPAYWIALLDLACERWSSLVSPKRTFGLNATGRMTGQQIVDAYLAGTLEYDHMGRDGGLQGPQLAADLEAEAWRGREYEVRPGAPPTSANWFPVREFVGRVHAGQQTSSLSEVQLDLLLGHHLLTGGVVADLLWSAVGQPPPDWSEIELQASRGDGRTTDVLAVAPDGRRLHVEDKTATGAFQALQPESYASELERPNTWTLLVAPQTFLARTAAIEGFSARVSTESIAAVLHAAAAEQDDPGTAALWRRQTSWLRAFSSNADPIHVQREWVAHYRGRIDERSDGALALESGTMSVGAASFAEFAAGSPAPKPLSLTHKLLAGALDLRVPGWTFDQLADRCALPGSLPVGWSVCRAKNARTTKATGEPAPVIRFSVTPLEWPFPPFDDCEQAIDSMIDAGSALAVWLQANAVWLAAGPPKASSAGTA